MALNQTAGRDLEEMTFLFQSQEEAAHARSSSRTTFTRDAPDRPPLLTAEEKVETLPTHPTAARLFAFAPFLRKVPLFGMSARVYGLRRVFGLMIMYFCSKGIGIGIVNIATYPLLKKVYKASASQIQLASSVQYIGFSIKVFAAILSDGFALFGYKKRWYQFVFAVLSAVSILIIGILPGKQSSVQPAMAMCFFALFCASGMDVLSEGFYSRLLRLVPVAGPSIVSWVWFWYMTGNLVASVFVGPLSDAHFERVPCYIGAPIALLVALVFLFNMYEEQLNQEERYEDAKVMHMQKMLNAMEEQQEEGQQLAMVGPPGTTEPLGEQGAVNPYDSAAQGSFEAEKAKGLTVVPDVFQDMEYTPPVLLLGGVIEFNSEVLRRNWRVFVYSLVLIVCVGANTATNIIGDVWAILGVVLASSSILMLLCFWAFPLAIAKVSVFSFVQFASYLQFGQYIRAFYMAEATCLPDGPHFTQTEYDTVGNIVGGVLSSVGAVLFPLLTNRSYYFAVFLTTFVQSSAFIFDLIIVKRWNRPKVDDHVLYILGDAAIFNLANLLFYLPGSIIASHLCPRGSEALIFGMLAGISNFGQSFATVMAVILIEKVWIVKTGDDGVCDFANLQWMLITGHLIIPLVTVWLVFFFFPSARLVDRIDFDGRKISEEEYERRVGKQDMSRAYELLQGK